MMSDFVNSFILTDWIDGLGLLPDQSVHCCVTSPPYFGLRDYGVAGQVGLEETPEQYLNKLVTGFREVRRVMRDDGTLWLNIGDSYAGYHGNKNSSYEDASSNKNGYFENQRRSTVSSTLQGGKSNQVNALRAHEVHSTPGLKPKDLIGIPWMLAFALRADGWYLRQDIIWHKPNPMPESVTDRCTKAHEYIFLLSKSQRYYYDAESIKTKSDRAGEKSYHSAANKKYDAIPHDRYKDQFDGRNWGSDGAANKRSVWTVTTKPFKEAHFATFPPELITDMIRAGCPEGGIVLDPFGGAGTTALVSRKLNRNFISFELNPDYIEIAQKRLTAELGMFV